jgi:hypothetical protein
MAKEYIKVHEEFRIHPEHQQYAVSNFGNVYSRKFKKLLKLQTDKDGYKYCFIYIDRKIKRKQVHRLVAETWLPNPENHPRVCHKTKRKDSNKTKDLFWCNCSQTMINSYKRGFYPSVRNTKKLRVKVTDEMKFEIRELLLKGLTYPEIAKMKDVSITVVYKVNRGKYGPKFEMPESWIEKQFIC